MHGFVAELPDVQFYRGARQEQLVKLRGIGRKIRGLTEIPCQIDRFLFFRQLEKKNRTAKGDTPCGEKDRTSGEAGHQKERAGRRCDRSADRPMHQNFLRDADQRPSSRSIALIAFITALLGNRQPISGIVSSHPKPLRSGDDHVETRRVGWGGGDAQESAACADRT